MGEQWSGADLVLELRAWLEDNWNPDLTVAEWWEALGRSGWAAPTWPVDWLGRGLSRQDATTVSREIVEYGALGPPGRLELMLAGPTILRHGSDEQKKRYLPDIVTGQRAWCQLFSEPGAGSDLAGVTTRATRRGEHWVVNGQKVWTSGGRTADLGMLVARTDVDVPKHQGITYFALNMHQEGVSPRALREMTGEALFSEVFLTDAVASDDSIVGSVNGGWEVTLTTLALERTSLGAGGESTGATAPKPGSRSEDLGRRAGDFVPKRDRAIDQRSSRRGLERLVIDAATASEAREDPVTRQEISGIYTLSEAGRHLARRQRNLRSSGGELPGAGNVAKLLTSQAVRRTRDVGLSILGASGMLHDYPDDLPARPARVHDKLVSFAIFSPAPSIYGGTDEIQKNILAERVLGLPPDPSDTRAVPFRELPKNG